MKTTLLIVQNLIDRARELTGINDITALVNAGLEALIASDEAKRLAALGCSQVGGGKPVLVLAA